jgi:hypothetical protein
VSEENPDTQPQPTPAEDPVDQALYRDMSAVVATLDQHSAEIDALQMQVLILMFALGALAGLAFVMHREVRALALAD